MTICQARRRRRLAKLLLITVLATGSAIACAEQQPPTGRNVIVIVVDTLRADHLGVYGYERYPTSPGLDRWAARGAVFDNAFSTSSWTLTSFGSIVTGQLPSRHGAGLRVYLDEDSNLADAPPAAVTETSAPAAATEETADDPGAAADLYIGLDESLPTLAGVFAEAGYATGAVTNNVFLDPRFGVSRGFQSYDHLPRDGRRGRHADEAVDDALAWIDDRGQAPFFFLLHLMDPHAPYEAPGQHGGRFSAPLIAQIDGRFPGTELRTLRRTVRRQRPGWELSVQIQQAVYDEEIAFMDGELDRFFTGLDGRGLFEDAVIIFTADHGEEFWDHRRFGHGRSMFSEVVRVPMIVWGTEVVPGRVATPASLVDVMPTTLEAAGSRAPDDLAGESMWPVIVQPRASTAARGRQARPLYLERTRAQGDLMAIVRWPLKAILNDNTGSMSLYDLVADPRERNDLASTDRDRVRQLIGELNAALLAAEQGAGERGVVTLDDEVMRELRALGYVR